MTINRRDLFKLGGTASAAAASAAIPEAKAAERRPIIIERFPTCECEEPLIKCDHLGCRCILCGGMERHDWMKR